MKKLEKSELQKSYRKAGINMKRLIEYCTIRDYYLYPKSFKKNSFVSNITIYCQSTLVSIKQKNSSAGNIMNQILEKMVRPIGCNVYLASKAI